MKSTFSYSVCIGLLLAVLLLPAGKVVATKPKIQLIETGQFHGDEVGARTGERWLGLFPRGNGFVLLPTNVSVEAVVDMVVDGDDTQKKSGKKITVHGDSDPVFLLKGATMLRPGSVVTIFREEKNLVNGTAFDLELKGKRYQLKVVSQDPEPKDYVVENSKLVLTTGRTSQTLISLQEPDDGGWSLLWAGDIDRDGKLDLYMDLSNHYNASQRILFLSSQAGKGKLVKELARFETVGC